MESCWLSPPFRSPLSKRRTTTRFCAKRSTRARPITIRRSICAICRAIRALTLEDYRHLYYGYAWQPGYKPFETPAAKDRILNILAKDSLAEADYLKIVEYGREAVRSEPYDPSTLNFLVYACGAVGDSVNERINLQPSERDFGGYRVIGRRAQRTVALACSLLFCMPETCLPA